MPEGDTIFRTARTLDATLDRLIATGRDLMRRNLGPGERRTTSPLAPRPLCVYRRSGRPCRRCGATIGRAAQGEQARSTYFCPVCQSGGTSGSQGEAAGESGIRREPARPPRSSPPRRRP